MRDFSVLQCVFDLDRAAAANLEAVVHRAANGERVGSKAGGGVIHFEFVNRLPGLIFDIGIDPVALAASGYERERQHQDLWASRYAEKVAELQKHQTRAIARPVGVTFRPGETG